MWFLLAYQRRTLPGSDHYPSRMSVSCPAAPMDRPLISVHLFRRSRLLAPSGCQCRPAFPSRSACSANHMHIERPARPGCDSPRRKYTRHWFDSHWRRNFGPRSDWSLGLQLAIKSALLRSASSIVSCQIHRIHMNSDYSRFSSIDITATCT